jgi:hypothetical protein
MVRVETWDEVILVGLTVAVIPGGARIVRATEPVNPFSGLTAI